MSEPNQDSPTSNSAERQATSPHQAKNEQQDAGEACRSALFDDDKTLAVPSRPSVAWPVAVGAIAVAAGGLRLIYVFFLYGYYRRIGLLESAHWFDLMEMAAHAAIVVTGVLLLIRGWRAPLLVASAALGVVALSYAPLVMPGPWTWWPKITTATTNILPHAALPAFLVWAMLRKESLVQWPRWQSRFRPRGGEPLPSSPDDAPAWPVGLGAAAAACGCLGLVKVLTPWISLLCTSLVRWDGEALGFFLARYWPGFLPVPGLVLLACGGWMLLRRRRAGLLTIGAIFQAAYAVAYPLIDEWWLNGLPFEPYEIQLLVGLAGPVACVAVLLSDRFCEQLEAWRKTPPIAKDVA